MTPTRRVVLRYLAGRPLDGRTGYPYLTRGPARWPGWKRQVARIVVPAAGVATLAEPRAAAELAAAALVVGSRALRRRWRARRFRREYVVPTLAAIRPPLGGVEVRLHVDPALGSLTPRLAKPLSPAEGAVRLWYGEHVEPALRYLPDRAMVGWWWVQAQASPVTSKLEVFRRPGERDREPRIGLTAFTPYLTAEQRALVSAIVHSKIPVADLVESWDQVGGQVRATWKVRRRPPARVGLDDLLAAMPRLKEWEFFIGLGAGSERVVASLTDDSAHIAESAGSGAGKSVLAQLIAVQVLARGGHVTILDFKGSHRWARNLAGVDYCTRPDQMHDALIRLAVVADRRNAEAFHQPDGWDPGARELIICEELNATISQLRDHWDDVRGKGDKKPSPGIGALRRILFTGRSSKVNVLAIAQMLTAQAIGGPEARENFSLRFLARYTKNAWKMLAPQAAMPRASRVLGRWQLVVGDTATEVQVCYLTTAQARAFASPVTGRAEHPDSALTSIVTGNAGETGHMPELLSITDALDEGVLPWRTKSAVKMRMKRAREAGRAVPEPAGKRGLQTDLYRRTDLAAWVATEGADSV